MSVNDICELGSILQGDDHEKAELERQVMAIDTAIQQQEARLHYEEEQRQLFTKAEDGLIKRGQNAYEHFETLAMILSQMVLDKTIDDDIADLLLRISDYELSKQATLQNISDLSSLIENEANRYDEMLTLREELKQSDVIRQRRKLDDKREVGQILGDENFHLTNEQQHQNDLTNEDLNKIELLKHVVNADISNRTNINSVSSSSKTSHQNDLIQLQNQEISLANSADECDKIMGSILKIKNESLESCHSLDNQIDSLKEEIATMHDSNQSDEQLSQQLSNEIFNRVKERAGLILQIDSEEQGILKEKRNIDDISYRIQHESFRHQSFNQRLNELNSDHDRISSELELQIEQMKSIRLEINNLKERISGQDEETTSILGKLSESISKREELIKSIQLEYDREQKLVNESNDLTQRKETSKKKIKTVSFENSNAKSQIETVIKEISEAKSNLDTMNTKNLKVELENLRNELLKLSSSKTNAESENLTIANEIETKNILLKEEQTKYVLLIQHKKNLKMAELKRSRIQKSREDLNSTHSKRVSKLRDDLLKRDFEFQAAFKKAEKELSNIELKLLDEIKNVETMSLHQTDDATKFSENPKSLAKNRSKKLSDITESSTPLERRHGDPIDQILSNKTVQGNIQQSSQESLKRKRKFSTNFISANVNDRTEDGQTTKVFRRSDNEENIIDDTKLMIPPGYDSKTGRKSATKSSKSGSTMKLKGLKERRVN